jgi:hypothetical protein
LYICTFVSFTLCTESKAFPTFEHTINSDLVHWICMFSSCNPKNIYLEIWCLYFANTLEVLWIFFYLQEVKLQHLVTRTVAKWISTIPSLKKNGSYRDKINLECNLECVVLTSLLYVFKPRSSSIDMIVLLKSRRLCCVTDWYCRWVGNSWQKLIRTVTCGIELQRCVILDEAEMEPWILSIPRNLYQKYIWYIIIPLSHVVIHKY